MIERLPPCGLRPAGLVVLLAAAAAGQDPATESASDPPAAAQLELANLRADVAALSARLAELQAVDASGAPAEAGAPAGGDGGSRDEEEDEEWGRGLYFRSGTDVDGTFLVFGDVGASYENPSAGGHTEAEMGDLAVLGNVNLGPNFRVLSETTVHVDRVGQERLWGQYTVSDALYVKLGTEHSPISRWNYEYHHGAWLETTIARPIVDRFEGDGGILPLHRTGLEAGGTRFTDGGSWQYFAALSNGRGPVPTDKQRDGDANDSKAIDVGANYRPASSPRTTFGGALTYDEIPADGTAPDRDRDMDEIIATANFSTGLGDWLLRSQYAYILHQGRVSDSGYYHNAGFVQLERPGEPWTPYARWGWRDMEVGDPFYAPDDRDQDEWRQTVGLRKDFHPHAALKFELSYGRLDDPDGGDDGVTTAAIQLSWYF